MRAPNGSGALAALLLALTLAACSDSDRAGDGTVRVAYQEVQCLENPWQQAWLSKHSAPYPTEDVASRDIFVAYWRTQGIDLREARRERYLGPGQLVCAACNCPTGYEWIAEVSPEDATKAEARGFQRR